MGLTLGGGPPENFWIWHEQTELIIYSEWPGEWEYKIRFRFWPLFVTKNDISQNIAQISPLLACFSLVSLFASARRRRAPVYSKWPPGASVSDYRMKMYIGTFLMDIWFQNDIPPDIGPFGCYCTECAQIPCSQKFPGISEICRNFHDIADISR